MAWSQSREAALLLAFVRNPGYVFGDNISANRLNLKFSVKR